jgi:[NiFe] hydrogenase diaphorase moiety large subunit
MTTRSVPDYPKYLKNLVTKYHGDKTQLLAMLRDIQEHYRYIPRECIDLIADELDVSPVQIEGTASFYHFFSMKPRGKYTVYLNTSATSEMAGCAQIKLAFEQAVGINFGATTSDGQIGLYTTSCIGMCDQEPAAMINDVVLTRLTPERVKVIVSALRANKPVSSLVTQLGDSHNALPEVHAEVVNNIRNKGPVFFSPHIPGKALLAAMDHGSLEVIESIRKSGLRGRGGAGFPTGQKWGFCRATESDLRYVLCNADEGEPGTFKDRVLLTEMPQLIFEGMTIAAYAIEAKEGLVYLRGEYAYLKPFLENQLEQMRQANLLGRRILGTRFSFDIQIKLGAGAYICGEESALIESAEGKRGQPRNRPPFPVVSGYLHKPTIVNNPETYGCAARIILNGPEWFRKMGTSASAGVKLLSVAGDCERPGVYEIEWGKTVQEILDLCGAKDVMAVQVGGPSGVCVSENQFQRRICYSDLGTGGAFTIFSNKRDLFSILHNHMEFFTKETCGFCVPCRAGNTLLLKQLEKIMIGNGTLKDLEDIKHLGAMVKTASRCGLGQTSPNPLLTSLENFNAYFKSKVRPDLDFNSQFNLEFAVQESCLAAQRTPNLAHPEKP